MCVYGCCVYVCKSSIGEDVVCVCLPMRDLVDGDADLAASASCSALAAHIRGTVKRPRGLLTVVVFLTNHLS